MLLDKKKILGSVAIKVSSSNFSFISFLLFCFQASGTFLLQEEHEASKDSLLTTLPTLGKEWQGDNNLTARLRNDQSKNFSFFI